CQAIEIATGATVSTSARLTRVLFAEVERVLARLWLLGTTARAAGQQAPFHDALEQREALFEALETVTDQRVYWAVVTPGGVRADLNLEPLGEALEGLMPTLSVWQAAVGPNGPLGRAGRGVGAISAERAQALGLTGIAADGSGVSTDLRRDQPYGGYVDLVYEWPEVGEASGDVAARMCRAVDDIATSLEIAQAAYEALKDAAKNGAAAAALKPPGAVARAQTRIEGPHGLVTLALALTPELKITGFRLDTPGAALLAALPDMLEGRPISQAPVILASLDLCMECLDQ
ncbi:MAG: hypothetical protein IVW57_16145, partial [Ktedonobacterales bacterium]|nr:hypothetical protein [Ktedonobacterales bacterium]